ncbi:uncharacterized protein LOC144003631 isoform X2 [Festucalex cinctus]
MAESAEGFVNGVQIIGDVWHWEWCQQVFYHQRNRSSVQGKVFMKFAVLVLQRQRWIKRKRDRYGENVGRADGCYMPVQSSCLQDLAEDGLLLFALSGSRAAFCWFDGLSQHQVVEEDLDQG